jgi:hypothetical protein
MNKKIIGMTIAFMFLILVIPQIGAVEQNKISKTNQHAFGLCYIENIETGDYDPADKCPYFGGITIFSGGEGTQTTIYQKKGGEEIAHIEGPQVVIVFLMLGYHEYEENSRTFAGRSFGVFVF